MITAAVVRTGIEKGLSYLQAGDGQSSVYRTASVAVVEATSHLLLGISALRDRAYVAVVAVLCGANVVTAP
jgi:hypothetical protein